MQLGLAPPAFVRASGPSARARADAPPAVLPAQHFAAALVFLIGAAAALVYVAPEFVAGGFYLPRVVAAVHLLTLGWMVLSIFGALCQFLPVAVGRPLRWQTLAHVSFALQSSGAATFVSGLVVGSSTFVVLGALALTGAFLTFAVNLASTLAAVRERTLTWWALAGAAVFLAVTPAYGIALALNLHSGALGAERFRLVAVHAHVAIVGFVLLVMVGVAQRLLPMFLLAHGASERPGRAAVALLFSGALVLALPGLGGAGAVGGGALAALGLLAFLIQAWGFIRHRTRRSLEPGMRLAVAGLLGLAVALLLAPLALGSGLGNPALLSTYFVVLLGAVTVFIAGHYYKIVPFLTWYHRFGPLVGTRKVPKVSELFSARVANVNAALLVAGWFGLALSTLLRSETGARLSAFVFAAGAALLGVVMARVARRRPA